MSKPSSIQDSQTCSRSLTNHVQVESSIVHIAQGSPHQICLRSVIDGEPFAFTVGNESCMQNDDGMTMLPSKADLNEFEVSAKIMEVKFALLSS